MPTPGDLLMERYRILERIGSGGMATVHRARDERLNRDVAIKVLLPNLADDPATAARFAREARSLAAAAHPGVVAVYDVDAGDPATGREPFFVMELCPGGSLADRLAGGQRVAPDDLIPVLVSIGDGLAELHRRGAVHRDVKPQNILFAADRAKLADFGVALDGDRDGTTELTTPGTAVGTLAYLAPEILAGGKASAASDVYALAVVAFVGLTGTLPRPAGSIAELVGGSAAPAALVSQRAADLGTAFDDPIGQALANEPAARPDALELASGLTAALGRWARERPSAGGQIRAAVPADRPDDPTTQIAVPVTATATMPVATSSSARPRPPARRTAPWLPPLAMLATVILVGAAIAAELNRPSGRSAGGPSQLGPSIAVASASPLAPSASAGPSAGPPTTPKPTVDPANAAIEQMAAAIAAARGGPDGLKGKEANDLESRLDEVRRALDAGDRRVALDAARKLQDRVRKVTDRMGSSDAANLRAAAERLVAVLSE